MNILFVGSVLPKEYETKISGLSNAGNRYQLNLINALKKVGCHVTLCSYIGVPMGEYEHDCVAGICCNEYYYFKSKGLLKQLFEFRKTYRKLLKEADVVISYNNNYNALGFALIARLKRKFSALILADYYDESSYKSIIHKVYAKTQRLDMRTYRLVIGLASDIERYLKKKQLFMNEDGGIDLSLWRDMEPPQYKCGMPVKYMYAGKLDRSPGVDLAVKAFRKLPMEDIELHITGNGDFEEWIKKESEADPRIHFHGRLEYEEYINLYKDVNILLNTRNMNMPENRNNFPSKMMEYIASGRVIVSTKFAGWEKYMDYALFCDCEINSIADAMIKAREQYVQNYIQIFHRNRELMLKYDWISQAKRIVAMIEKRKR